ncbi:hypothetical protein EM595_2972 [Duffyella gerundensis]|uniref:Uncharacterized protein n=1 Tax=Duffyella gerundensis TaxID=1619313 RepID=A0A0U5L914_9GAMM|nr:hypothetical protein EM595_2972 [Duffyella gerundensis]
MQIKLNYSALRSDIIFRYTRDKNPGLVLYLLPLHHAQHRRANASGFTD